jgi:murein DD-endopeptidase MepM/ murein hydrolase activator NlpD
MNMKRFLTGLASTALVSSCGVSMSAVSSTISIAPAQAQAAGQPVNTLRGCFLNVPFDGKIAFNPTNIRRDPTTVSPVVGQFTQIGQVVRFSGITTGQSVNDAWDGKPDNMWYRTTNGWVASAVTSGYPPRGNCSTTPPPPPLQPSPTSSNPLRGFLNPLDGKGTYSGVHAAPQQYADDLGIALGTPIKAMRSGKVIALQQSFADVGGGEANQFNANYVLIEYDQDVKHQSGKAYRSLYLHVQQNSIQVKIGDRVNAGDVIARVGNNGWSTAAHLHVEVNYSTGTPWYQRQTVPYVWNAPYDYNK